MGEVYRATDTNLKRAGRDQGAAGVGGSGCRSGSLASSAKPRCWRRSIIRISLPIHGLEQSAGITALVMELIEGPTLADRIAQGAIPVDEALAIATQIADALAAAHDRASSTATSSRPTSRCAPTAPSRSWTSAWPRRWTRSRRSRGSVSMMPTITTPAMTQAGVVLGTAAYMSPSRRRGGVDARTRRLGFGAMLYEMLTGRRAFGGDDVADTLANVLKSEPDWRALPAGFGAVRTRVSEALPGRRTRGSASTTSPTCGWRSKARSTCAPDSASRQLAAPAPRARLAWLAAGARPARGGRAGDTRDQARHRSPGRSPARPSVAGARRGNSARRSWRCRPTGDGWRSASTSRLRLRSIESGEVRPLTGTQDVAGRRSGRPTAGRWLFSPMAS